MIVSRRGFLLGLGASAATLAVPELLLPSKSFFLPPKGGWAWADPQYYGLGYCVTREELADNLYGFGLAAVKAEGGRILYDQLPHRTYVDLIRLPQQYADLFK